MVAVTLDEVSVQAADGTVVLHDTSFSVGDGELVVLVGPSGSGKSSAIRAVAGLDQVVSGRVLFDDVDVTRFEAHLRDVGIVFQNHALFPNQNARRNIGFPLRLRSVDRTEIKKRVDAEARALQIDSVLDRWPEELSAGHQQLVQLARALVRVPKVLLMDEPMAHLDPPTRSRLRVELRDLQQGYGVTTLYATNDPREAMFMADRIVALERGTVRQIGTPMDLYSAPATTSIAWHTGPVSFVDASVEQDVTGFWLVGDGIRLRAWTRELIRHVGQPVRLGIRPEHVVPATGTGIRGLVEGQSFEWGRPVTQVRIGGWGLSVRSIAVENGSPVELRIVHCLVFDALGELAGIIGHP